MMSAPYLTGGKPTSRLRAVTYPGEESVGYSVGGGRGIDERLSERTGATTFASIHGGAQPLVGEWSDAFIIAPKAHFSKWPLTHAIRLPAREGPGSWCEEPRGSRKSCPAIREIPTKIAPPL